ncbi:hypothetical protein RSAG8_11491, partial [Rhizoctonia solani AG-8 WAC10335]
MVVGAGWKDWWTRIHPIRAIESPSNTTVTLPRPERAGFLG